MSNWCEAARWQKKERKEEEKEKRKRKVSPGQLFDGQINAAEGAEKKALTRSGGLAGSGLACKVGINPRRKRPIFFFFFPPFFLVWLGRGKCERTFVFFSPLLSR